jgi:glutamyl/glutaminyl-tRNA synthetase
MEYRQEGYMPQAMVNYLALLGWNPGTEQEFFSMTDLVEAFSLERIQKSGARFDEAKLLHLNQEWMRSLSDAAFIERGGLTAPDSAKLAAAVPLLKERAQTFSQARELLTGELSCLFIQPKLEKALLLAKEPSGAADSMLGHLNALAGSVQSLHEGASTEDIKAALMPYADSIPKEQGGRGAALWPLRYALSGLERSPDPFTLINILGKNESMMRIQTALAILAG